MFILLSVGHCIFLCFQFVPFFVHDMVLFLFAVVFSVLVICSLLCLGPYVTVLRPFVFVIRHSICCINKDISLLAYVCLLLVNTLIFPFFLIFVNVYIYYDMIGCMTCVSFTTCADVPLDLIVCAFFRIYIHLRIVIGI